MISLHVLSNNISKIREERGLTISGMAERSGISKSILSDIENGIGEPTIETIWAIANTLDVPFGVLVTDVDGISTDTKQIKSTHTGSNVKLIERTGTDHPIEVYTVDFPAGQRQESKAHPIGVIETVSVISGALLVGEIDKPRLIHAGESYAFPADVPHIYEPYGIDAKTIIKIEYPVKESLTGSSTQYLDWPSSETDWDGVQAVLERIFIEVSNGISSYLIHFRKCNEQPQVAKKKLVNFIKSITKNSGFSWPLHKLVDFNKDGPYFALLPLHFTKAFTSSTKLKANSTLHSAAQLARLAESPFKKIDENLLHQYVHEDSWTISTLASETLAQRGDVILPTKLSVLAQKETERVFESEEQSFSSRINVDHYDAFELLHPAYARQVVAVAEDIIDIAADENEVVHGMDVGTGPGVPLLMLHELFPQLRSTAIEPDNTAYACLIENIGQNSHITPNKIGFLDIPAGTQQVPVITSFGASHHFNTAFMLQKAMDLLLPGGLLSIADEFLPEYSSAKERNLALIKHHSAYILTAIQWIENLPEAELDDFDANAFRRFRKELSVSVIEAESGLDSQAVNRCRQLYIEIKKLNLSKKPHHTIGAYTRFFWLELQAMVAGFDYEVERKTYPKRFLELATLAGFELIKHRRVFATTGSSDWDGGTHVFTFKKPEDY